MGAAPIGAQRSPRARLLEQVEGAEHVDPERRVGRGRRLARGDRRPRGPLALGRVGQAAEVHERLGPGRLERARDDLREEACAPVADEVERAARHAPLSPIGEGSG